jgi:uncharacterized protein YcaQ
MPKAPTLDDLRRYAVARTLFKPTTLARAIGKLGFVQADPIRAPARAQDLILRHRVAGYGAATSSAARAARSTRTRSSTTASRPRLPALMHPRTPARKWDTATEHKAAGDLPSSARGPAHRGSSRANFGARPQNECMGRLEPGDDHLLDVMHYRGLLRVRRRESGTRI